MSAGPSSSGAVLGLAYTTPIMLLHQILEPEEEKGVRAISHRIPGDQQQCPPASGHTGARNQGDAAGKAAGAAASSGTVTLPCTTTFWLDSRCAAFECVIGAL